jgi:polyisoprenoid-binding protein YceI
LKNVNVGFHLSPGPCSMQLRAAGIPSQEKRHPYLATVAVAVRRAPLRLFLALVLLFAGAEALSAQVSGSYRVNTHQSRIEIHLFKGGFLSVLGDNHLITLTHFSGMAKLSQTDGWKADLLGDAASLRVIDPWGNPSERREVEDTMLGPAQLDVNNFPSIKLHSVSFDPTSEDTAWSLLAEVELHGVTRKAQFSLDCHEDGDRLQIRGKKMFKLTDFNIQPFSTAFGAVKVKNNFEVIYDIVLERVQ